MKVAVTGSSGLVGSALVPALEAAGHEVWRVVRSSSACAQDRTVLWDSSTDRWEPLLAGLELDAVIHLAGENIARGRWTVGKKAAIRDSRVGPTARLANALAGLSTPPKVLLAASAIGYYGDRGDELLSESSGPGGGFLSEVCRAWESAIAPAVAAGIRVVNLRIGLVVDWRGGALAAMAPIFKFGLGGRLGSGRQWMSWIHLDDLVACLLVLLQRSDIAGPVNAVAPNPVTNAEFTAALATALGRWAILPAPAFALKLAMGEMADALLLASTRVTPTRLLHAGFAFAFPELPDALAV